MRSCVLGLGVVLLSAAGCGLFGEEDPAPTDGNVCRADDECSTGTCTLASLCSHSVCRCPSGSCAPGGEETSACRDGWVCVGYESFFDPVVDFFGGEPNESNGYCAPRCADGCPEHYTCEGELCMPDEYWAYPVPNIAWSGAASGETAVSGTPSVHLEEGSRLTLVGSATSPDGTPIERLSWTISGSDQELTMQEGESLEITIPAGAGGYRHVELTVYDARTRTGNASVTFEACLGTGTACGWEGSGCCTSCDDATSTCR